MPLVNGLAAACVAVVAAATTLVSPSIATAAPRSADLGVYAGPAATGVAAARAFDAASSQTSAHILDFEADATWAQIEGPAWAIGPHVGQGSQFELSVPMLPAAPVSSLTSCAAGDYNSHWVALATSLVAQGVPTTVVRPGWEMNGNWYRWSALASPGAYAGCFRAVVASMRSVAGSAFTFDWTVGVNLNSAQAVAAWPGDGYVDYVGVDVYDQAWTNYLPGSNPTTAQQAATIRYLMAGPGGLQYWAGFAAAHNAALAIPEWGLSHPAAHGGGDDPQFIDAIFDFISAPANHVAFATYFNTADHQLTAPTDFPMGAAEYRVRASALSRTAPATATARSAAVAHPVATKAKAKPAQAKITCSKHSTAKHACAKHKHAKHKHAKHKRPTRRHR